MNFSKAASLALLTLTAVVSAQTATPQNNPAENAVGNGSSGFGAPPPEVVRRLLSQVYPEGVPPQVSQLLAQGSPEALRQAWTLIRQARGDAPGTGLPQDLLQHTLNRAFPQGVPGEVRALLGQGSPQALQQARQLLHQALENRVPEGTSSTWGSGQQSTAQRQERFLARVYPEGVPTTVRTLLEQPNPDSQRRAWDLVRQALLQRFPDGYLGRVVTGFRSFRGT